MSSLKKLLKFIDSVSETSGWVAKWFALVLVFAGTYEAVARHFFDAPTEWAYDVLCMAGGALYMLGASYDYLKDSHTRVDMFYNMLPPRGRAFMNVICSLFLFFPLMLVMLKLSFTWAVRAVKIKEVFFNSFWYPPAWPYRSIFAAGVFLLVLQAGANLVRDFYFMVRGETLD
ncbi:MAG: TRAP transporter small permease subunit [Aminivibrio sp.]|jgi:TRAP-type mannitol/chloroaromatic compound transport system permease small subunit|nr:TRAP transporter small permease subunit [Synergistaceae bacterium]